jgi:hypothetical protein
MRLVPNQDGNWWPVNRVGSLSEKTKPWRWRPNLKHENQMGNALAHTNRPAVKTDLGQTNGAKSGTKITAQNARTSQIGNET